MIDVQKLREDLHDQGYHLDTIIEWPKGVCTLTISPIAEHPESIVKKWDEQCDEQLKASMDGVAIPAGVKMISSKL